MTAAAKVVTTNQPTKKSKQNPILPVVSTSSTTTTTNTNTNTTSEIASRIKYLLKIGNTTSTSTSKKKNKNAYTATKQPALLDDRTDATRLDELRRLIISQYQQQQDLFSTTEHGDVVDSGNNNNIILQQWKEFIQNSYKELIQQLILRIQLYGKRTAVRTLWGIIASIPIYQQVSSLSHNIVGDDTNTNTTINTNTNTTNYKTINTHLLIKFIKAIVLPPSSLLSSSQSVVSMVKSKSKSKSKAKSKSNNNDDDDDYYNDDNNNDTDDNITNKTNLSTSNNTEESNTTLSSLVLPMDKSMRHMIGIEFIQPYRDVQYYMLIAITQVCNELYETQQQQKSQSQQTSQQLHYTAATVERLFEILLMIPSITSQDELDTNKNCLFDIPESLSLVVSSLSDDKNDTELESDSSSSSDDKENDFDTDDDSSVDVDDDDDNVVDTSIKNTKSKNAISSIIFLQYNTRRNAIATVWLSILRLLGNTIIYQLPTNTIKDIFNHLCTNVIPIVPYPLRFADFFITAYSSSSASSSTSTSKQSEPNKDNDDDDNDNDSSVTKKLSSSTNGNLIIPVLALDGLFDLIINYNLEYNKYYEQLYTILQSSKFVHVRYKTRFLQLISNSLQRNIMIPAYILASFIKRLLRTVTNCGSPNTILYVLALISNILNKHPEVTGLIHRQGTTTSDTTNDDDNDDTTTTTTTTSTITKKNDIQILLLNDVFDNTTNVLEETNALQSSLWELHVLENHYYPPIVSLAKSIGTLTKTYGNPYANIRIYDIDTEFLTDAFTYNTLFEQERYTSTNNNNNNNNNNCASDRKRKRITNKKSTVPLTFRKPTGLFTSNDVFHSIIQLE